MVCSICRTVFRKMITMLVFICAIASSTSNSALAYMIQNGPSDVNFVVEKEFGQSKDPASALVIYDNISDPPDKHLRRQVAFYSSVHFTPIDHILCNPPLRIGIMGPATMEDRLRNLLYADLKLKMLIDEYQSLRQKSLRLLGQLEPLLSESRWWLKPPGPDRKRDINLLASEEAILADSIAIRNERARLEHEYALLSEHAFSNVASRTSAAGNPGDGSGALAFLAERERFSGNEQAQRIQNLDTADDRAGMEGNPSVERRPSGDQEGGYAQRPKSPGFDRSSSLPWIVSAIFGAFSYLVSHKSETLVYSMILLGFVALITSVKQR